MDSRKKEPALAVVQLTGGNDALNTLVPYVNPLYMDNRPVVKVPLEGVLPINDELGFNPVMGTIKKLYDEGKVAIVQGVGYPNPNRSHFRSMDIWHTCEPEVLGTEGWLGRALRELDPRKENVLTGVNFGRGLPRALVSPGVPVASVGDLATYGLLTGIEAEQKRQEALGVFANMYSPVMGRSAVTEYLSEIGMDALKGAEILSTAPEKYSSTVEYGTDPMGQYLKDIAQVHLAEFGTRVFYCAAPFNAFDTHARQPDTHTRLWTEVSKAVNDFYSDLQEHGAGESMVLLLFTEFGRRVKDNGSGTDHGAGGIAMLIGDAVKGGLYGEYPSLEEGKLDDGDLAYNNDFRGLYSTILERWLAIDSAPAVGGVFEQMDFL